MAGVLKVLAQRREVLRRHGLTLVDERRNKHHVWTVQRADGFTFKLTFPSSASDHRSFANFEADIKRALNRGNKR